MILSHPLERLLGRVGEPADARDVAQVCDVAQLLAGLRHGSADGILVGHVAAQRDGAPAGGGGLPVDLGGHRVDGVLRHVEARHRGTLGGQAARRGSPDARSGPGDDRHLPGVTAGRDRLGGRSPGGIGLPDSGGGAHARSFSSACPLGPLPSTPEAEPRFCARSERRLSARPCRQGGEARRVDLHHRGQGQLVDDHRARRGPCSRRGRGHSAHGARRARERRRPRPPRRRRRSRRGRRPARPPPPPGPQPGWDERVSSTSAG